jgi:hypothetical protein
MPESVPADPYLIPIGSATGLYEMVRRLISLRDQGDRIGGFE